MRAVLVRQYGPFGQAEFAETEDPVPGLGEVIVDVKAAEANYADILFMEGTYQVKPPLPFSPGLGAAGRVSALGDGVEGLSIGDRVLALPTYGAYAEKLKTQDGFCFPIPAQMSFETATALGLAYQTAYFALKERARIKAGDAVLVLGATGGIGLAAIQLSKAMGARLVIGCTRGAAGMDTAKRFGCDYAVDAGMEDPSDGLRDAVRAITDGKGVDIVIDPVGGPLNAAALRTTAWSGRLVIVGFASGEIPVIRSNYLLVKNIAVNGLQWTDYRARELDRVRAAQSDIFSFWQQGRLDPHIGEILPLACFAEALAKLHDGEARGKLILTTEHQAGHRAFGL